jgi:CheY-like chemotaxis protein
MSHRILVVDDDANVHELIRWTLRAPRFEIHSFTDPQRALERIRDIEPDLIICDMMMPTMDGQLFLRLVKQSPELRDIPFLFLTAVRLGSEIEAALEAGAEAYLVKPFPLAKLVETVNTVLDAAQRRPSASYEEPTPSEPADAREGRPQAPTDELLELVASPQATSEIATPPLPRAETPSAPAPVTPEGVALPTFERRFSKLRLKPGLVKIVTEAESRPNLVITTVLSLRGRCLKKIETYWSHPLQRQEDLQLVKRQIDLQHDRAVEDAAQEPLFGPRRKSVWASHEPGPTDPSSAP